MTTATTYLISFEAVRRDDPTRRVRVSAIRRAPSAALAARELEADYTDVTNLTTSEIRS